MARYSTNTSTPADLTTQEIASALAARRELGPDCEEAIAAALAEKMAQEINARVSAELLSQGAAGVDRRPSSKREQRSERREHGGGRDSSTPVAIASLIAGIPITAIVAGTSNGNVFAIGMAWVGIGLVNVAHALGRRRE